MPEVSDFSPDPLSPQERRQVRLMWFTHGVQAETVRRTEKQREAWRFWLGIILPLTSIVVAIALAAWSHGVRP